MLEPSHVTLNTPFLDVLEPARTRADSEATRFACTWTPADDVGVGWIQASGELNLAGVPLLRETLRDAQHEAGLVVLDLRELTFWTRAGLRAIVDAGISACRRGGRLIVVQGRDGGVQRQLAATEAADQLEVFALDPAQPSVQVLLELARQSIPA